MFERIQPDPLFLGNMFSDDVTQLLDQGQLAVFRVEVCIEQQIGQPDFFRQRRQRGLATQFNVHLQRAREGNPALLGKTRRHRQPIEPHQYDVQLLRHRHRSPDDSFIRELHESPP